MLNLMVYELRKLMSWKWWILSLSAIVFLPLLFVLSSIPDPIESAYYAKYRGIVDEQWFQKVEAEQYQLETEYQALSREEKDRQAMDFHNSYFLHSNVYSAGSKIYKQEWKNAASYSYSNLESSSTFPTFVKETMEAHQPYLFGDSLGAKEVVWTITYMGFFISGFVCFLMSRIFNIEQQGSFHDLLKSTKEGKRKAGYAKIAITLLVPVVLSTIVCILYVGITTLLFHPDFAVSTMVDYSISPFTYGDITFYGCIFVILGSCALSLLAALFSVLMKSSFRSLVASLLLFIAPVFTQSLLWGEVPIARLIFPTNFMFLLHTLEDQPMIELQGVGMMMSTLIPIVWLCILVLLILLITYRFQRTAKN